MFRGVDGACVFSFCLGDPLRYIDDRPLSPLTTGILVGDGVRGDVLNFNPLVRFGEGDIGELSPKVACAIRVFKSDSELRRLFFGLTTSFFSSIGGEAPIVLSREDSLLELSGRSSNAPSKAGLSRDTGRLPGDSIDFERLREDPLDKLDEGIGSPVATLRFVLLSVLQTDGRSSLVVFCRRIVSANRRRRDDALEVNGPVAE